jgi:hypothetical protein
MAYVATVNKNVSDCGCVSEVNTDPIFADLSEWNAGPIFSAVLNALYPTKGVNVVASCLVKKPVQDLFVSAYENMADAPFVVSNDESLS